MRMSIKNGGFSYGKTEILKDINLDVKKGEMTTILGPNGVGKTTLIKCLLGFKKWTSGATFLDCHSIKTSDRKLFWKKISYVPQAKEIPFLYTVESIILMGRNPFIDFFGKPKESDLKEVDSVLDLLGLKAIRNKCMDQLSGGEKQMVLIARALVSKPEIVVLDEPELNLDLANQDKIFATLRKLVDEEDISCLINTHHPFNAIKYSDYSLLLKRDLTYIYGKTKEVVTLENIINIFELPSDYYSLNPKGLNKILLCKSS